MADLTLISCTSPTDSVKIHTIPTGPASTVDNNNGLCMLAGALKVCNELDYLAGDIIAQLSMATNDQFNHKMYGILCSTLHVHTGGTLCKLA